MQVMSKKYCRFDFVRYITERQLNHPNGIVTISITEKNNKEQIIFFKRNYYTYEYEILVYKCRKSDHYIKNSIDEIKRVEESSVATTFFFDTFAQAKRFLQYFGFYHKEYQFRPSANLMVG